jgi:hypothetical protein
MCAERKRLLTGVGITVELQHPFLAEPMLPNVVRCQARIFGSDEASVVRVRRRKISGLYVL